jgi:hypothetical protein
VVSLSNHGKEFAAVLRQAQDEGSLRGEEMPSQPNWREESNPVGKVVFAASKCQAVAEPFEPRPT